MFRGNKNMFVSNDFMHVPTRKLLNSKLLKISVNKPYFTAWLKEKLTSMITLKPGQLRMTGCHLQILINTTTFQKHNNTQLI